MKNNQIEVQLSTDIKKDRAKPIGIKLMSRDINNNQFVLRFKSNGEPLSLSDGYTVEVLSQFVKAKTEMLTEATVYDDYAKWAFDTSFITQDDTVYNYVYVKRDGVPIASADANAFYFEVGLSKIDEGSRDVAEYYDSNYEQVLHEFEVAINLTKKEWAQMADATRDFVEEIKDKTVDEFVELKMGEELQNLETNYATRLTGLTAQLAQKANEQAVETELAKKRNMTTPLMLADLHTEVKTAMTGGSVAVVGNNAVGEENIKVGSVTFDKLKEIIKIEGVNSFDKNSTDNVPNKYINSLGAMVDNVDYTATHPIDVTAGLTYQLLTENANSKYYAFYNSEGVFISGSYASTGAKSLAIVAPIGASVLKVAHRTDTLGTLMIARSDVGIAFEPYVEPRFVHDRLVIKEKNLDKNIVGNDNIKDKDIELFKLKGTEMASSKNLFNKNNIIEGKYVIAGTGALGNNPSYVTFEKVIDNNNSYVFSTDNTNSKYYAFYDAQGLFIDGSGVSSGSTEMLITPPSNSAILKISARVEALDTYMLEVGTVATEFEEFWEGKTKIPSLLLTPENFQDNQSLNNSQERIYNLSDIYAQWKAGNKFPIAFLGDSTTAGDTTTGFVGNVAGTDYMNQKSYPYLFEQKAKTFFGNPNLRVYNAGFSGTSAGSITTSLNAIFGVGSPYADVKMVGISYGINDRHNNGSTTATLMSGFKTNMEYLINWFKRRDTQPFLVTPQVVIQPEAKENEPLNDSINTQAIMVEAIKDLAEKHNLEWIDKNDYTTKYIQNTMQSIDEVMADSLHFSDLGHEYEAGMHFHLLTKSAYEVKDKTKITPMNPYIRGTYTRYDYKPLVEPINGFTARLLRSNLSATDRQDFEMEIFISERPMTLKAYVQTPYAMYVKVDNGEPVLLSAQEVTVELLEMGLHKIELWSGNNISNFLGFKLE